MIKGDPSPVPQGLAFDFDPRDGLTVSSPFRGEFGAMLGYSATLRAAGIAHSFTQDGLEAEIVLRTSRLNENNTAEEVPQDEWSIEAQSSTFSLYEHPKTLRLEKLYPNILSFIKADVEASKAGDLTMTPYSEKLQGVYESLAEADALVADMLLRRLITDGTEYSRESYKLVHTQTVSGDYGQDLPTDGNVLKLYNYGELEAEVTDSSLTVPCPERLLTKLENAFTDNAPDTSYYLAADYYWGFRKSPAPERLIANGKVQVITEYTLELWSLFAYDRKS